MRHGTKKIAVPDNVCRGTHTLQARPRAAIFNRVLSDRKAVEVDGIGQLAIDQVDEALHLGTVEV